MPLLVKPPPLPDPQTQAGVPPMRLIDVTPDNPDEQEQA